MNRGKFGVVESIARLSMSSDQQQSRDCRIKGDIRIEVRSNIFLQGVSSHECKAVDE